MAEFISTAEERATAAYLDWDDEALGRFTRYVALEIGQHKGDQAGLMNVFTSAAALILVKSCHKDNVETLTLTMENITTKDGPLGTWEIDIRKVTRDALARTG